jgi:integrase/recombinase XerD
MTLQVQPQLEILEPSGSKPTPMVPTVGDGLWDRPETFEEYLWGAGLALRTVRQYENTIIRARRKCHEWGVDLLTANAYVLAALADAAGPSHPTRATLRCALKHYYLWQDRLNAPLRAVRVPPQPAMVCKALSPEDAARLEQTARGWWPEGAAVLLGLYLGLRRAEIAMAEWERFDDRLEWYTVTGKGDKTATIPVHEVIAEEFRSRRHEKGWVFPGRKGVREGSHVTPATVWEWTGKVAVAAGVEDNFSTHVLRHTALTTALDATENLRAVQAFARHSDPQVTSGYTRTTQQQLRVVSDALGYAAFLPHDVKINRRVVMDCVTHDLIEPLNAPAWVVELAEVLDELDVLCTASTATTQGALQIAGKGIERLRVLEVARFRKARHEQATTGKE